MKPLTPDLTATGVMKTKIPDKWLQAFTYLTMAGASHSEIASFPGLFLAAWNGNDIALKRVLEAVFAAHYAGSRFATNDEQRSISNALIFLGNSLAEYIERGELPTYDETPSEAASTNPK